MVSGNGRCPHSSRPRPTRYPANGAVSGRSGSGSLNRSPRLIQTMTTVYGTLCPTQTALSAGSAVNRKWVWKDNPNGEFINLPNLMEE
jgi:hypothetical protein